MVNNKFITFNNFVLVEILKNSKNTDSGLILTEEIKASNTMLKGLVIDGGKKFSYCNSVTPIGVGCTIWFTIAPVNQNANYNHTMKIDGKDCVFVAIENVVCVEIE